MDEMKKKTISYVITYFSNAFNIILKLIYYKLVFENITILNNSDTYFFYCMSF